MSAPPDIEEIYAAVGQLVVFFQMVEDSYRRVGWFLVDPERKNWPPMDFRQESNRELIDKVTDRFVALTKQFAFPNGAEWAIKAEALRLEFHELRKYRNRVLHSAYTEVVAGGQVVTVLRTSPRLYVDPDTGELVSDQEDFSPDSVQRVLAHHAVGAFSLLWACSSYIGHRLTAIAKSRGMAPNPSIERTSQRPLRALCAAAHVER